MRKKTLLSAIVCIALFTQGLAADEPFTWKIALVKLNQGRHGVPLDENGTANMNRGDKISIEVSTEKDCWVYIVAENASGQINYSMSRHVKRTGVYLVPITSGTLNPPSGQAKGQTKFHVVTSLKEQKGLQDAIDQFKHEGSESNALKLRSLLNQFNDVFDERGGGFMGGIAMPSMGGIRGDILQTEFSGNSVYSQTITINY